MRCKQDVGNYRQASSRRGWQGRALAAGSSHTAGSIQFKSIWAGVWSNRLRPCTGLKHHHTRHAGAKTGHECAATCKHWQYTVSKLPSSGERFETGSSTTRMRPATCMRTAGAPQPAILPDEHPLSTARCGLQRIISQLNMLETTDRTLLQAGWHESYSPQKARPTPAAANHFSSPRATVLPRPHPPQHGTCLPTDSHDSVRAHLPPSRLLLFQLA